MLWGWGQRHWEQGKDGDTRSRMGTGTLGAGLGHPSGALLLNAPRPLGSQAGWGQTGMMQGLGCDRSPG